MKPQQVDPKPAEDVDPDRGRETAIDPGALIRGQLYGKKRSAFGMYRSLTVGDCGLLRFLWYELLTTLIGPIPGALGLALRSVLYRTLFKEVGKGVVFGRNLTIRHPDKIRLGSKVVLDDYALIDGRGAGEEGICIGERVIVNRNTSIQAKSGSIRIGPETNVGAGSLIVSMGGVEIGSKVGIGGGCYISGGAFRVETAESQDERHEKFTRGAIRLGDRCWLGMRVTVLDGVLVGEDTVVGAGSVVSRDLPPGSIAAGAPAKVLRSRSAEDVRPASE